MTLPEGVLDQAQYERLTSNPSFSLDAIEEVLIDYLHSSYDYLYEYQVNMISLGKKDYTGNLLYIEMENKYVLDVERELVEPFGRAKFKTSSFCGKELTLDDIYKNRDIFMYVPMVFIDDKPTFTFTIKPDGDKTFLYFKKNDIKADTIKNITVIFLLNNGAVNFETNKYVVDKYNGVLPMRYFDGYETKEKSTNLAFVNETGSNTVSPMGSYVTKEANGMRLNLNQQGRAIVQESKTFNMTVISANKLYNVNEEFPLMTLVNGVGTSNPFAIENTAVRFKMPIPTENILVFKYQAETLTYNFYHKGVVNLYYPNIYTITDPEAVLGDKYKIYFFYDEELTDTSYLHYLSTFFDLVLKKNEFGLKTIPEIVKAVLTADPTTLSGITKQFKKELNYRPHEFKYDNRDLNKTMTIYHFDYKIRKFDELVRVHPDGLSDFYVDSRNDIDDFYLFTKLMNLTKRERNDNSVEKYPTSPLVTFDEPHYVFALDTSDQIDMNNYRFFVDGFRVYPIYYYLYHGIQYIYLPKSIVTADSYIEIQYIDEFEYNNDTLVMDPTKLEFDVDLSKTTVKPLTADIRLTDHAKTICVKHDEFSYEINGINVKAQAPLLRVNGGATVPEVPAIIADYTRSVYGHVKLTSTANNKLPVGTKLLLSITKVPKTFYYPMLTSTTNICSFMISEPVYYTKDHLYVYLNGRLIDEKTYSLDGDPECNKPRRFSINYRLPNKSIVIIDLNNNPKKRVYTKKQLTQSEIDNYIDLGQVLNQPFSLDLFDLYINGLKMGKHNVIKLTATKIKLVNVKSFKNFYVYDKTGGAEPVIDLTGVMGDVNDRILGEGNLTQPEIKAFIDELYEANKPAGLIVTPSVDTEPDYEDQVIMDVDEIALSNFYDKYVYGMGQVNPDMLQIPDIAFDEYPIAKMIRVVDPMGNNVVKTYIDPPGAKNVIKPYFK